MKSLFILSFIYFFSLFHAVVKDLLRDVRQSCYLIVILVFDMHICTQ